MEAPKFFDVERDILKEENFPSESKQSPERPSSPADCAICLEQLKDKSFTNSCLHMFCFHCLEAWSKVWIFLQYGCYENFYSTKKLNILVMIRIKLSFHSFYIRGRNFHNTSDV